MFVAHKSNQILSIEELEWECRRKAKGIKTLGEYWAWIETITDSEGVITYPSEDFTIVEVKDEDERRIDDLMSYISFGGIEFPSYNIKWSNNKVNCEEVLGIDGKSQSPKVYVQSHFKGDDTAKDARLLAEEWTNIRRERDRLLAETDWMTCSDSPTMSEANKTYRQKLRDLPSDQSSKKTSADITWPSKP
jgi:hypothetical protein